MKTKTAAEAWEKQRFDEPQGFGRSHVLSHSEFAEYRGVKGIIPWFLSIVLGVLLGGIAWAAEPADDQITVMSFNILRGAWAKAGAPSWNDRKADVFQTIQGKGPDFVGTQEEGGGQMEEIIAALPAYREVPGRDTSRTGGILYLHEKWNLVEHGRTNFSGTFEISSRYFIWGLFTEKTTNRMIYIYSLHLSTVSQATLAERVAAMELMGAHTANRLHQTAPVILTGDFNSTVDIDTMKTLTGEIGTPPFEFIYAFKDLPVSGVSYGIDHILALPGTTVVDSGVAAAKNWDSGSDHPAVFAVIEPWFGELSGFPKDSVRMEATDPTATEEGETTATFHAIRQGDTSSSMTVNFSVSGTATEGVDYVLSASSPITIPAGQSSVQITLTPTDDDVFGERDETVILTITPGDNYVGFGAPATATIEDNDNHDPVANAGVDRQAILGEAAWSPADIATTAWYDAADTSTITASADAVSVWQDKSGNSNHAAQSTASSQPANGGAINGLNAINFNPAGATQHLTTDLEQLTTVSIYLVINPTAKGTSRYSAAIGASLKGYEANSGLFWPIEQYDSPTERNDVFYTDSLLDKIFCNGVEDSADHNFEPAILSHQGTNLPTSNRDYLIGNRAADLQENYAYKGLMGEIIICPEEHDLATRQKMEGYLAHKWDLTANLPASHPYKNSAPQADALAAAVALTDATATDTDINDPLIQNWEVVSKPAEAADPTFSSTTVITPTVTFTAPGSYVLRLTASDGIVTHSDEVTIKIYPKELSQYWIWADTAFAGDFTDNGIDVDPDGDGLSSLLEFAFGTDPTVGNGTSLATNGSAHGQPKVAPSEADMEFFFVRRKDHGTSGSVTYRVEFSGDLATFFPTSVEPSFVANSSSDAAYEVVKVPFPAALPDSQGGRFGRLVIAPVP